MDDVEKNIVNSVVLTSSLFSLLGSIFIIRTYLMFVDLRIFPFRIMVFLSIADMMSSISYIIGALTSLCFFPAIMTQYFDVATFCWTSLIVYMVIAVLRNRETKIEKDEYKFHLFGWGIPACILSIALLLADFGEAGNWCWITKKFHWIRFSCYYIPMIISVLFNIVGYILSLGLQDQEPVQRKLRLVIIMFVFCRMWSVIHRFQEYVESDTLFVWALLHAIFVPLQGFVNALVFGCNKRILFQYRYLKL